MPSSAKASKDKRTTGRAVGSKSRPSSTRVGRTPDSLDPRHAASELTVPALVLHDPADAEVPWSHGERVAAAWPGARLEPRPGTGHRGILHDRATIESVVGFVRALAIAPAAREA